MLFLQISLAVFSTYVLISPYHVLDPHKAFVTLSLVNVMNLTIATLPLGTSFLGQVSLVRQGKVPFLIAPAAERPLGRQAKLGGGYSVVTFHG